MVTTGTAHAAGHELIITPSLQPTPEWLGLFKAEQAELAAAIHRAYHRQSDASQRGDPNNTGTI